jgi:hypothetical protein
MYEGRGIWDFDVFEDEELERLIEINKELVDMGLDVLPEEMMDEVNAELQHRNGPEQERD